MEAKTKNKSAQSQKSSRKTLGFTGKLKKMRPDKIVLGFCLLIGLTVFAYAMYGYFSEPWSEPQKVHVTNVTGRSATISWVTEEPTKGYVLYSESSTFAPWIFSRIGKEFSIEDRDVTQARLDAALREQEKAEESDEAEIEYTEIEEDIVIENVGQYYTHHVTVKGLDPEKKYYFKVGNGVRFETVTVSEDSGGAGDNSFTTTAELDEIPVPNPAYGKVMKVQEEQVIVEDAEEGGEPEFDEIERNVPVTDGIAYMKMKNVGEDGDGTEESTLVSAPISEEGAWYIDLTSVRDSNGEIFWSGMDSKEFAFIEEQISVEAGVYGSGELITYTNNDAPAADVFVDGGEDEVSYFYGNRSLVGKVSAVHCPSYGTGEGCYDVDGGCNCPGGWVGHVSCEAAAYDCTGSAPAGISGYDDDTNKQWVSYCQSNGGAACWDGSEPGCDRGDGCEHICGSKGNWSFCEDEPEQEAGSGTGGVSSGNSGCWCEAGFEYNGCGFNCHFPADFSCADEARETGVAHIAMCYNGKPTCERFVGAEIYGDVQGAADYWDEDGVYGQVPSNYGDWPDGEDGNEDEGETPKTDSDEPTNESQTHRCDGKTGECKNPVWPPGGSDNLYCCDPGGEDPSEVHVYPKLEAIDTCETRYDMPRASYNEATGEYYCEVEDTGILHCCDRDGNYTKLDKLTSNMTCRSGYGYSSAIYDGGEYRCGVIPEGTESGVPETEGDDGVTGTCTGNDYLEYPGLTWRVPFVGNRWNCNSQNLGDCRGLKRLPVVGGYEWFVCNIGGDGSCTWTTVSSCEDAVEISVVTSIDAGEQCCEGACACPDGTIIGNGYWCREVTECNRSNDGKVCNGKGETCDRFKPVYAPVKDLVFGEDWRCNGPKKEAVCSLSEEALTQNNSSLVSKVHAESLVLSPTEGVFVFEENGYYCTEYKEEEYCFNVSAGDPAKLFVDVNEDGVFNGDDVDLSADGTEIEFSKELENNEYLFRAGFNFVSLDLVDTNLGIMASTFLENLNAEYSDAFYSIAKYDSGWVVVGNRDGESYGDTNDFQIIPGKGYVVRAKRDVTVRVSGKRVIDPVPSSLREGWNLMAAHGASEAYTAESLIDAIDSVASLDADNVTRWVEESSKYEGLQKEPDDEGVEQVYGFDFPIQTQSAYFVRIDSGSGEWSPD